SLSLASNSSGGATLGVGGFGVGGGDAGNVSATIVGNVLATGSAAPRFDYDESGALFQRYQDGGSHGVLLQSVGGAGGNGGINVSGGIQYGGDPASPTGGLNLGIGGFGGSGGD